MSEQPVALSKEEVEFDEWCDSVNERHLRRNALEQAVILASSNSITDSKYVVDVANVFSNYLLGIEGMEK